MDTGFWFKGNKFRKWALKEGLLNNVNAPCTAMDFLKILDKWAIRKRFYHRTLTLEKIHQKYKNFVEQLKDDCDGLERQFRISEFRMQRMVLEKYVTNIQDFLKQENDNNNNNYNNNNINDNNAVLKKKQTKKCVEIEKEVKKLLQSTCKDFVNENKSGDKEDFNRFDDAFDSMENAMRDQEILSVDEDLQKIDYDFMIIGEVSNLCTKYKVPKEQAISFDEMLVWPDRQQLNNLPNLDKMIGHLKNIQHCVEMEKDPKLKEKIFQKHMTQFVHRFIINNH